MIRVFYSDVRVFEREDWFEESLRALSDDRRKKIERIKSQMDRCRSLTAGLLLKQEIINAGIDYDRVAVSTGLYGKPYLVWKDSGESREGRLKDFHYSISHGGNYAALAVSDRPVGVDIEGRRKIHNLPSFTRRILTPAERQWLDGQEPSDDLVIWIWTRKEAWVKRDGSGLSVDFRKIDTVGGEAGKNIFSCEVESGGWLSVCGSAADGQGIGEVVCREVKQMADRHETQKKEAEHA